MVLSSILAPAQEKRHVSDRPVSPACAVRFSVCINKAAEILRLTPSVVEMPALGQNSDENLLGLELSFASVSSLRELQRGFTSHLQCFRQLPQSPESR